MTRLPLILLLSLTGCSHWGIALTDGGRDDGYGVLVTWETGAKAMTKREKWPIE